MPLDYDMDEAMLLERLSEDFTWGDVRVVAVVAPYLDASDCLLRSAAVEALGELSNQGDALHMAA